MAIFNCYVSSPEGILKWGEEQSYPAPPRDDSDTADSELRSVSRELSVHADVGYLIR